MIGDTITCALDFDCQKFFFGKNGHLLSQGIAIPAVLCNKRLFPIISFKVCIYIY